VPARAGTVPVASRTLKRRRRIQPAFVFVAPSGPPLPRVRQPAAARAILDGVNAAFMALVTWQLARAAPVDAVTMAVAAVSALLLLRWKLNSAWLVLGGAVVGLLVE